MDEGVLTMTVIVGVGSPLAGANVVVDSPVPLYAWVMVTVGVTDPGVLTTTVIVGVGSPLAGASVVVDSPVPL
jgi:hypothetical protein